MPFLALETGILVPARLARGRRLIVEGAFGRWRIYIRCGAADAVHPTRDPVERIANGGVVPVSLTQAVPVRIDPPVGREQTINFWNNFAGPVGAVSVVPLSLVAYHLLE